MKVTLIYSLMEVDVESFEPNYIHFNFSCLLCPKELEAIRDALCPPLACAAAKIGDIEALNALKEMVNTSTISALNLSCQF